MIIIDDTGSDIFHTLEYEEDTLFMYTREGRFNVYGVERKEIKEFMDDPCHEACMSFLKIHGYEFFPR